MTDQELLAAYKREPDGSWTLVETISGEGFQIGPGVTFGGGGGVIINGVDIVQRLNDAAARHPHLVRR
ncbi:hypothetical protein [Methylobacterium sp. Leaf85]|uniref:hypothetical protein n=1 Tax=Methylobacterium sp. Leaf85 TaxID=1736241 RepID=UPI000A990B05|nr:hypothetical protein [Methylobacterium sp. Leaf85]